MSTPIPRVPLLLGLAGLIPFWGLTFALALGPAIAWLPGPGMLGLALAAYGALIVSFLGGIRWGLATSRADQGAAAGRYAFAVVPSLLAWAALALPLPWTLASLAAVALALAALDQGLVRDGLAPPWFGRLRLLLSLGAALALLAAAAMPALRG